MRFRITSGRAAGVLTRDFLRKTLSAGFGLGAAVINGYRVWLVDFEGQAGGVFVGATGAGADSLPIVLANGDAQAYRVEAVSLAGIESQSQWITVERDAGGTLIGQRPAQLASFLLEQIAAGGLRAVAEYRIGTVIAARKAVAVQVATDSAFADLVDTIPLAGGVAAADLSRVWANGTVVTLYARAIDSASLAGIAASASAIADDSAPAPLAGIVAEGST